MNQQSVILVTGAAGFIGSYLVGYLNKLGYHNIIICDDFSREDKVANYKNKVYSSSIERERLFDTLDNKETHIDFVFHLGARTDTTEFDYSIHERLNVAFSQNMWNYCTSHKIPLVYASSAATYGGGELGYKDDHDLATKLQPLNAYGVSKNEFDKWALMQTAKPPFWAGLKFFNVYGPNEYHKGRMASVIFHSFHQIVEKGQVRLFRSHRPDFKDGEQLRDFIYVEDVAAVCYWLMQNFDHVAPGLYNLGTGKARSFNDLVNGIYKSLNKQPVIEYFDTPLDIRDKYQYFTEADMQKLRLAGYTRDFYSLEDGINEYVTDYLVPKKYY